MKTPITKEKFQNHITYSSWKYILLVVAAIFGWNIIYSMTQYQPPEEKKVILGIYSYGEDVNITPYMQRVQADLLPEMEDVSAQYIVPDEAYGAMILSARIAARECDIYVLPRTEFQNYAAQGGFMPLDEVLPELIADLEAAGVSLSRGYRANDGTGEKHQYGIPCADLPSMLTTLQCDTKDMYAAIFFDTGNDENVITFFNQFIRDMMLEPETPEVPAV